MNTDIKKVDERVRDLLRAIGDTYVLLIRHKKGTGAKEGLIARAIETLEPHIPLLEEITRKP